MIGCQEVKNNDTTQVEQLKLIEKELEIQEKELELAQREQSLKSGGKKKKLVHLFAANGGMIGYYDDGTTVGCPRCDFSQANIDAMSQIEPMGKWDTRHPELLKEDTQEEDWVLFDYKWQKSQPR